MTEQTQKTPEEIAAEQMDAKSFKPEVSQELLESEPPKKPAALPKQSEIAVRDGLLQPVTLTESTRIARGLIESGCIPKQYDTVPKVLMGMQVLRQLGLPDIACLPRLAIINGTYSLWGEGPKALCQDQIEDFEEFWFDKAYKPICFANQNLEAELYGSLCRIKRKGIATWTERVFTVPEAKEAKLWDGKDTWKKYPKRMLQMRARSWALKDAFPDKLLGVSIAEYDHDVIVDAGGNPQSTDLAPTLVEKFK